MWLIKNTFNAFQEKTFAAIVRKRERQTEQSGVGLLHFLNRKQGFGISEGVVRERNGNIIAPIFAFCPNIGGYPPNGGIKIKNNFNDRLQDIEQVVTPRNVREFMR